MTLQEMQDILDQAHTIAFIGLSEKPERYSHQVAHYLQDRGFRIIPVNPSAEEILGEKSYASLQDIPVDVQLDIVSIFRSSDQILPHVQEALARDDTSTIWLAEGIHDQEAEELAESQGRTCIANRCIMKVGIATRGSRRTN